MEIFSDYYNLIVKILSKGEEVEDRTGTGTTRIFGATLELNMDDGFPILTTQRVHFRSIIGELIWFLSGDTNTQFLAKNGITIWDNWADKKGNLGPIYGKQWRAWNNDHDQILELIRGIKEDPFSRRHLVSAWNVAELHQMALPPCHYAFQFCVGKSKTLDLLVNMRSADVFLGLPFNIASYALLLHMIAKEAELTPARLLFSIGDAHIYNNHQSQCIELIGRKDTSPPTLWLNPKVTRVVDYTIHDVNIIDYRPHGKIKAPISV